MNESMNQWIIKFMGERPMKMNEGYVKRKKIIKSCAKKKSHEQIMCTEWHENKWIVCKESHKNKWIICTESCENKWIMHKKSHVKMNEAYVKKKCKKIIIC